MEHPLYCLPFEWHDLAVGRIAIVERGVVIDVLPYNDAADRYDHVTLSLLEPDTIAFDIQGELSPKDLGNVSIMSFDIVESSPGRISGTLGILPESAGYWTIRVANALWHIEQHGAAGEQFPSCASLRSTAGGLN
jgi:hypothetical protein